MHPIPNCWNAKRMSMCHWSARHVYLFLFTHARDLCEMSRMQLRRTCLLTRLFSTRATKILRSAIQKKKFWERLSGIFFLAFSRSTWASASPLLCDACFLIIERKSPKKTSLFKENLQKCVATLQSCNKGLFGLDVKV